ncbi:hypothetical protein, partial [Thermococcus sp. LS2]
AREYIFDDKRSLWHTFLGFISAFTLAYSIVILLLFTLYQVREREKPTSTLGDVVEFVIGYVYGLAVLVWLKIKGVV